MAKSEFTPREYKIYFTPRTGETSYGAEIEVSAKIIDTGVSTMKRSIDAGDYDIGVFYFGDVNIKAQNIDGVFSSEFDNRSIFTYSRDLTKVRVEYNDKDGAVDVFNGLIDDKATKENFTTEVITFRALSFDSVIRVARVPPDTISDGTLASAAFKSLLNRSQITSVLTFDATKINPANDVTIDVGEKFDNITTKDAISKLLLATNSVFIIDSDNKMVISSRDHEYTSITTLYGPYSKVGSQNILSLKKYNDGKQRQFTVVKVGEQTSLQQSYVDNFGYRQKNITSLDFITNTDTQKSVGEKLVDEFKFPKIELEVELETSFAKDFELLDWVNVDYPLRVVPDDKFLPIVDSCKIGETSKALPNEYGSSRISYNTTFKVIEIKENVKTLTTILKLRQTGKDLSDGYFDYSLISIVGISKIDISTIGPGTQVLGESQNIDRAIIGTTQSA